MPAPEREGGVPVLTRELALVIRNSILSEHRLGARPIETWKSRLKSLDTRFLPLVREVFIKTMGYRNYDPETLTCGAAIAYAIMRWLEEYEKGYLAERTPEENVPQDLAGIKASLVRDLGEERAGIYTPAIEAVQKHMRALSYALEREQSARLLAETQRYLAIQELERNLGVQEVRDTETADLVALLSDGKILDIVNAYNSGPQLEDFERLGSPAG